MKKTVVVIHAQFLPPGIWEDVMWGSPETKGGKLGVIPKAIQVCLDHCAELLLWCQGIPVVGGREVSPDALKFTQSHLSELRTNASNPRMDDVNSLIYSNSIVNNENQTTAEETAWVAKICADRQVERVIVVSPPKHIFRCHLEALKLQHSGKFQNIEIMAVASEVDFPGVTVDDVAIVEKSHRSDMPAWQVHLYVRSIFGIMKKGVETFEKFLTELGELLERYGQKVDWKPKG